MTSLPIIEFDKRILEFEDRSLSGPLMKADEFDVMLAKKIRQLVKKYELKSNPNEVIVDDDTADKVFNAAVEYLADVGVYNVDTSRVIKWTEEEIRDLARLFNENPRTIVFGRGNDATILKPRTSKDTRRPAVYGTMFPIFNQELYVPSIQSIAQERCVDGLKLCGGIAVVNGVKHSKGRPSEMYCGLWEAEAMTEALRRAGRPDMMRGSIPTANSFGAVQVCIGPGMSEPFNAMLGAHIMPEQKLNYERLNIAFMLEKIGMNRWVSASSLVGGLCGGPAGAAIGITANILGQLSYTHGSLGNICLNDANNRTTERNIIWAKSAAITGINRNLSAFNVGCDCCEYDIVSCHEEAIIGGTLSAMMLTAAGGEFVWECGTTALTHRIQEAAMTAVAGMDGAKVNQMIQKAENKMDEMRSNGLKLRYSDQLFPATYNAETLKPKQDYLDAAKRSVDILKECGVPLSDNLVID